MYLKITQKLGNLLIGAGGDIEKSVERLDQPRADIAAVIGSVGHADDLEAVAVVDFKQFGNQMGGRMAVKVGRQIGNADSVAAKVRHIPFAIERHYLLEAERVPGACELLFGRAVEAQKEERIDGRCSRNDPRGQLLRPTFHL